MNKRLFAVLAVFLCVFAFSMPVGAWETEVVDRLDAGGTGGASSSIAVDSWGAVHVSSYNSDIGALQYSTNASGSWVTTTVDSAGDVGWHTSIALDGAGNAHISYHDSTLRNLKYATNASGSWVTTTVDSAGDVGVYTSIALDGAGKVHISYLYRTT